MTIWTIALAPTVWSLATRTIALTARANSPRNPRADRDQAEIAEQVLRPPAEPRQELHRDQVEEPLDEPANAVLRLAELPRPVVDDQFADLEPAGSASTGMKRCSSPYSRISRNTSARYAFIPQLWSCRRTPVTRPTIQLNTRLGSTLCHGSCRTFFQPLTTSSPPAKSQRGSAGSRAGRPAGRRRA